MTKKLKILQILVYYDIPEIFTAIDEVGTKYLCLLVDSEENRLNYISTAISSKRLAGFINGLVNLREIFESPEINEWYFIKEIEETSTAELWKDEKLPAEFLPEKDFVFKKSFQDDELLLREVVDKNNTIIHLSISDSEENHSVDANFLGDIVKLYQNIVENSYKKALCSRGIPERKIYNTPHNYKLRAFASSYSSFNIHLYSVSDSDLFGNTIIEIGLEKLDEITRDFENDDEFIKSLKTVKGHTISSLKKLVTKLIENNITVRHKWSAPNRDKIQYTEISNAKAEKILSILNLSEELSEETKSFSGYFVQVDIERKTWRIYDIVEEKEFSGEASPEHLKGITVKTIRYQITCQEIIEELKVSEKEKVKYIMQKIEPLK